MPKIKIYDTSAKDVGELKLSDVFTVPYNEALIHEVVVAYLANNRYAENIYYQNFLLTSQKNREKLKQSTQTNSKKKIKYN